MMCKHCEWCDLAKNRCLLYEKQCYDKGKPINRDCQFFKQGEWGDNAEIPDLQYCIEFREFLLSSENGRNDLMQSVC